MGEYQPDTARIPRRGGTFGFRVVQDQWRACTLQGLRGNRFGSCQAVLISQKRDTGGCLRITAVGVHTIAGPRIHFPDEHTQQFIG